MNIILIGFKYSGKTSVGKILAAKLKKPFLDTDELIEEVYLGLTKTACKVREIYQQHGEEYFRQLERTVIASLVKLDDSIIATGGGSILATDNVVNLKNAGKLIYLSVPYEVLKKRYQKQVFIELNLDNVYEQRRQIYERIADIEIYTENAPNEIVADQILLALNQQEDKGG